MNAHSINPMTGKREQATVAPIDSIDDLANTAPAAHTPRRPTRKTASYMTRAVAGLGMLLYAAFAPQQANSALIDWDVSATPVVADWDAGNLGDELRVTYLVYNTSSLGDANNLIQFSVNAGSNHGVYNATAPSGWTASIFDDSTSFSGSYIPPKSDDIFRIFSYHTQTTPGIASAIAGGGGFPEPFPEKNTIIPIPEPGTALLFLLGGGAYALLKRQHKEPEIPKPDQNYK